MWTSASAFTCASRASRAAWRAVEWAVSPARASSSSAKLASCTSSSASCAAIRVISQGAESPAITTLRPARGSPITWLGSTGPSAPSTVSPAWSRAKSGPSATPSRFASSGSNRPGRSSSTSAYPKARTLCSTANGRIS